jgi:hypothetical protein
MAAAAPAAVSLNPGDDALAVLDFTVTDDSKFYHRATTGLPDDMKYDLSPLDLRSFLDNVSQQSSMFGWNTLLTVPTAARPRGVNLLVNYGQVTLAECAARAGVYLNRLDRTAQNSTMLYHFLYSSLTKAVTY